MRTLAALALIGAALCLPSIARAGESARMGAWLVTAEDGAGLRFAPAPGAHPCAPQRDMDPGFLPLKGRVSALATWNHTVYASLAGAGLLEIDARDPAHAFVKRHIPHADDVRALAATPARLYALTGRGLEISELSANGLTRPELHPEIQGTSIEVAGRELTVTGAETGPVIYRDISPAPQPFEVTVTDDIFTPSLLSIAVGDTVRWTNVSGGLHNVVSCNPAQIGCESGSATESFTSGPATGFWSLDHTFTQAGSNPYLCQPHAFSMTGSVTVTGSAGAPPMVPDGRGGAPMLVTKVVPDASTLSIAWDATTCLGAVNHEILYGYGFGLPGSTGGGYELAGAQCSIGASSPYAWTGVPPAFTGATGFVYWLVVATDGAATEGSWGKDGASVERQGPGLEGASDECGVSVKNLTNACAP